MDISENLSKSFTVETTTLQPVPSQVYLWGFICSIISIIGSIFIISTYILVERTRKKFFVFLVVQMTLFDITTSLAPIISENNREASGGVCTTVAFFRVIGNLGSLTFACLIAATVYYSLKFSISDDQFFSDKYKFLVPGYFFPFFLACIPLINQTYGQGLVYCNISVDANNVLGAFELFSLTVLPTLVALPACIYFYIIYNHFISKNLYQVI